MTARVCEITDVDHYAATADNPADHGRTRNGRGNRRLAVIPVILRLSVNPNERAFAMQRNERSAEATMDPAALYQEDNFADRKVGSIRRLTPVKPDGSADPTRPVLYLGQAQFLTPMGALPLSFEITATSLTEAVARFPDAARQAFEHAMEELREMRREAASSIIIPELGGGGMAGPGGLPGGGKIQLK